MTAKKSTTRTPAEASKTRHNRPARPKGKTRHALEARARGIVADVKRNDYDTRRAIAAALEDATLNDRQVADMLTQAEAGELVEHPMDCFEQDYRTTAHAAVRFLEIGLPDWLLQTMCQSINAAARVFNINVLPADGEGNYSAQALADLFRVSETTQYDPTLADHIAGVLNHPDCPVRIYNKLSEAVGELAVRDEVVHRAEVIRLALALNAEEEGRSDD